MDQNSPSGMYKCTECNNITTHIQGKDFAPCSECNKNSWVIINKDKDYLLTTPLEKVTEQSKAGRGNPSSLIPH